MYIVDANYFPGYSGVAQFHDKLTDFIKSRAREKQNINTWSVVSGDIDAEERESKKRGACSRGKDSSCASEQADTIEGERETEQAIEHVCERARDKQADRPRPTKRERKKDRERDREKQQGLPGGIK